MSSFYDVLKAFRRCSKHEELVAERILEHFCGCQGAFLLLKNMSTHSVAVLQAPLADNLDCTFCQSFCHNAMCSHGAYTWHARSMHTAWALASCKERPERLAQGAARVAGAEMRVGWS